MKSFRFPLERVRKWRQDQAEIEEMRLQQIYSEIREIEAERKEIKDECERTRNGVLSQQYMTGQDLASLEALKEYTQEQLRRIDVKRRVLETRVQEQLAQVLEAHRRFQLVDGLRDRAIVSWTRARDKEQEDLAAELYLAKLSREIGESRKEEIEGSKQLQRIELPDTRR